jgi:ketosteroid isomerase-like protein
MPTNLYELILKTLNKTNITIAEGYMLARKIESFCDEVSTFTLKVDDEGFRIEVYFKVDNPEEYVYYEEMHILSVFADGMIGEFKEFRDFADDEFEVEIDKQGTVTEYLQDMLPNFKKEN